MTFEEALVTLGVNTQEVLARFSGNLGFTALYEASSALVAAVRSGDDANIVPLGEKVISIGDNIVSVLSSVEQ